MDCYLSIVCPLPLELKCLVIGHTLIGLDLITNNNFCAFMKYITLCPYSGFTYELCEKKLQVDSLYIGRFTAFPPLFVNKLEVFTKKVTIDKLIITHRSSDDQVWDELAANAKEVVLNDIKNWFVLKFKAFDKVTIMATLGLNAYNQLDIKRFPRLKRISVRLSDIEVQFFEPNFGLFSLLENVTIIYDGSLEALLSPNIFQFLSKSNCHLRLLWVNSPLCSRIVEVIKNCAIDAMSIKDSSSITHINQLERLNSLFIDDIPELNSIIFKENTLKLLYIGAKVVKNCDFSDLKRLDNLSIKSEVDTESLHTISNNVKKLALTIQNYEKANYRGSKIKLPSKLQKLTFNSWDALEHLDFSGCHNLTKLELSGRLQDLDQSVYKSFNENHPIWQTLPESLSSFTITFSSDDFGYFKDKFFGFTINDKIEHLDFFFDFQFKCLICADARNDNQWYYSIQQELKLPCIVINNVSNKASFILKQTDHVLVYPEETSDKIALVDSGENNVTEVKAGYVYYSHRN